MQTIQIWRRSGAGLLVIAMYLSWAVVTSAEEPAVADPQLAFRLRVSAALDKKLDWAFKETPLAEVAAHLTKHSGVPVKLFGKKLDEVGVTSDTPVTFSARQLTLRTGLKLCLQELELTWRLGASSLLVTTPEDAESRMETRVYDVADLLERSFPGRSLGGPAALSERMESPNFDPLIDTLTTLIAPQSWDTVGGPGAIHESGTRSLAIAQTWEVHEKIERFWAAWRRMKADCAREPFRLKAAFYGDPAAEATWQTLGKMESHKIDMPLSELTAHWTKSLGIFVGADRKKLDELGVTLDTPVQGEIQDVRFLDGALEVLDPLELSLKIVNEAVVVTSHEDAESELFDRFYPVYDLCPAGDTLRARQRLGGRLDELEDLVHVTIGPQTWDTVGGPGASRLITNPPALAISQTLAVHRDLERLFTELRAKEATPQARATAATKPKEEESATERRVYRLTVNPFAAEGRLAAGNVAKPREGLRSLSVDAAEIAKLVRRNVDSASWDERDAALDWFENRLICKNTPQVLEEVEEFLLQMDVWAGHERASQLGRPFMGSSPIPVVGSGGGFFSIPSRGR